MRKQFAARLLVILLASSPILWGQTTLRKIGELELTIGGITASVSPAQPVIPKNISSGVRIVVSAGGTEMTAAEVRQFLGGEFTVQGTLSGPGLSTTVDLPQAGSGIPVSSDPLLLLLPSLPKAGDYTLSNLRIVVNGQSVLDLTPGTVTIKVIDQVLVTSVQTRALTLAEIQEKGIVLESSDNIGFEFEIGLVLESKVVSITMPAVFTRQGVPVPQPLKLPEIDRLSAYNPGLPTFEPVLMKIDKPNETGIGTMPGDATIGDVYIPAVLVIPGNVGYLKQFFSAQLYVANGAPLGSNLVIRDVTAKINLPAGDDADPGTPDDPLSLPDTSQGPQLETLPVLGRAADNSLTVTSIDPGQTGQAEFLIRGEKEGFHQINFDVKATLDGLATGPVRLTANTTGGVLVRNPYFEMTFMTPGIVRKGNEFTLYVSVSNISQALANNLQVSLSRPSISGFELLSEDTQTIETLRAGQSQMVKFQCKSLRTGKVVASYLHLDTENGTTGRVLFTLGVDSRNVPLSPDTLSLPASVNSLPSGVLDAAMRVLGEAWGVANAASGTLPIGVIRISRAVVTEKALALAEAGLRQSLGQPLNDVLKDLAFDFWGGSSIDPGFDQLLRQSDAGHDFATVLGGSMADPMAQAGGPMEYQQLLSGVAASTQDSILFTISNGSSPAPVSIRLVDAKENVIESSTPGGTLEAGVLFPLGTSGMSPVLGMVTSMLNPPYTLEITGLEDGTADLALSVPRGDGNIARMTAAGVPVVQGQRMKAVVNTTNFGGLQLMVDTSGDGSYSGTYPLAQEIISPSGPKFISATVIGPETFSQASSYGVHMVMVFDRAVDKARAANVSNYAIPSNAVQVAGAQLSGRLVFASLNQPEGPYVPTTVEVNNMADLRGKVAPSKAVSMQSRLEGPGSVVSGRVLNADGTAAAAALVTYVNKPNVSPDACPQMDDAVGIAAVPVDSNGYYEFRYIRNSDCGLPYEIDTKDPVTNARHYFQNFVSYAGERLVYDFVLYGRGAVSGTVRDPNGLPISEAHVYAMSVTDSQVWGEATTDASGSYRIEGITVGAVTVRAFKSISLGVASGNIFRAGATAIVDVTLDGGTVQVSGIVRKTLGGETTTVHGALVVYVADGTTVGATYTNKDGFYKFEGMPVGTYRIYTGLSKRDIAEATGVAIANDVLQVDLTIAPGSYGTVTGMVKLPNGSPAANAIVTVDGLGVLSQPDGSFVLPGIRALPSVSQTIEAQTINPWRTGKSTFVLSYAEQVIPEVLITLSPLGSAEFTLLDPAGHPASGQEVRIIGLDPCGYLSQITDSNGKATFANLPLGTIRAKAFMRGAGYMDVTEGTARILTDGSTAYSILRFQGVGSVTGKVLNPDGSPSHGALVELISKYFDGETCSMYSGGLSQRMTTGTAGTFVFNGVNLGKVGVRASQPFYPVKVGAQGILDKDGDVENFTLTLVETISGELSGTVFMPDGITPAGAGVEVTANGPLPDITVQTNDSGRFVFAKVFPSGRYTLTAKDPVTGGVVQEHIVLQANQDFVQNLRLLGTGTVRVQVVDGAGVPVSTAFVKLGETEFPNESFDGYLNSPDGIIAFENVFEGPVNIVVTDGYGRGGRAAAVIPPGTESIDVKVQLTTTGTVQGHFRYPNGTPVPYGAVSLFAAGRIIGHIAAQGTGDVGFFSFDYVPAGPVTLTAQDPVTARTGYAAASLETEGEIVTADVIAGSLGNVQGRVTHNGLPQPGVIVRVTSGGSFRASATADSEGRYYISGVPEGSVTATASFGNGFLSGASSAMLLGDGTTLTLDVIMRASGSISGRILEHDGVTPAPLATVQVEVGGFGGGKIVTTTNAQGNYSFNRVPSGDGNINVEVLNSIDRGKASVSVPENDNAIVDVTLNGVGGLTGLALDSTGQPVAGTVYITGTGAFKYDYVLTADVTGAFRLPVILAGPFNAKLKAKIGLFDLYGFTTGSIAPDRTTNIQIQLQPSGTVTARVMRADGTTPAVGADVKLRLSSGAYIEQQVQTDGRFTATGVPLSTFTLSIRDALFSGLAWIDNLSIASNEETVDLGTIVLNESAFAVISTDPADGTGGVDIHKTMTVSFNSPLQSTYGISVKKGNYNIGLDRTLSEDSRTVTLSGTMPDSSDLTLNMTSDVTDKFGRKLQTPVTIHFTTTDLTGPSVVGVEPANNAIQIDAATPVLVTFSENLLSGLNPDGIVVLTGPDGSVSGQAVLTAPNAITFTPSAGLSDNTKYTVHVAGAADSVGNVQTAVFTSTFMTPDTVVPVLEMIYPSAEGYTNSATPEMRIRTIEELTGLDPATLVLTLDGQPMPASLVGNEIRYTPAAALSLGQHTLSAQISDRAGNPGTISTSFGFDFNPPVTPVFTGLAANQIIQGIYTFSASASDDISGVARIEVYADGNLISTLPSPGYSAAYDTRHLSGGSHQITARALDNAGNASALSDPIRVYVSNTALTINITSPAANAAFRMQVQVNASANKAVQEVSFTLGNQTITDTDSPYQAIFDLTIVPDGTQTVTVSAVGTVPGEIVTTARNIIVDNTAPASPDTNRISAEPPTNGISLVHGSSGAVESRATVLITHVSSGVITTCAAAANGSFAASIPAEVDDLLSIVAVDAVGNNSQASLTSVRLIPSVPPSSGSTSLHYEGKAVDIVGLTAGSYMPDGLMDGVFTLDLNVGEELTRTISYINLSDGYSERSTRSGYFPLGVTADAGSPLLNGTDGTINFPITSSGTLSLIAGDNGFIAEGRTYTAKAVFTDGSQFIATYRIVPASDRTLVAHSATVTASPAATVVVSTTEPGTAVLTIDDIRDIDGTLVPDGAKIAISAVNMASMDPTGQGYASAGGTITGGDAAPNNPNFKVFTITGGQVTATYTSDPATPASIIGTQAIVQVQAADASGNVLGTEAIATMDINIRAASDKALVAFAPTALYADGADRRSHFTVMVRDASGNLVSDGTPVLVTVSNSSTLNPSGNWIASDGGQIVGGQGAAAGSRYRLFFTVAGRVEGDYSSSGIEVGTREVNTAVIQVLPASATGAKTSDYAIGTAKLPLIGVASAVIEVVPGAVPYVFPESSFAQIFVDHVKDRRAGLVPDGSRILISASSSASLNSASNWISSAGGTILDGEASPSGTRYRVFALSQGRAVATYSIAGVTDEPGTGETKTANIQILMSDSQGYKVNDYSARSAPLRLLGPSNAVGFAQPPIIFGDGGLHTTTVTFGPLLDAYGNVIPDGTKVLASAASSAGIKNGQWLSSAGGQVLNGTPSPSGTKYKVLTIQDGKVMVEYGDQGVVSDPGEIKTANVVLLPADSDGSYLSYYIMGVVPVKIAGLTSATGSVSPGSLFADGNDFRATVTLTNFKDAAGQQVPDGTSIAVSAKSSFVILNGQWVSSYGGKVIGDIVPSWDSNARLFTIANGQVVFEFTSQGTVVDRGYETARIQVRGVTPQLGSISNYGLTSVSVRLLSQTVGGIVEIAPRDLTGDGGDHRSQIVVSGLLESDNVTPVPDGTKEGLSVITSAAIFDGQWVSSAGGQIISADTSPGDGTIAPNNSKFQIYTVAGGQIRAAYSDLDVVAGFEETKTARVVVAPADINGNVLTNYALAVGDVKIHGITSATPSGPSSISISSGSTAAITFSGIRDSAGNLVPDGAGVAVTVTNSKTVSSDTHQWTSSTGGLILDGEASPSGTEWKFFRVQNGSVTVTYSPQGATAGKARIQLVPAKKDGTTLGNYSIHGGVWAVTITN